MPRDAVLPGFHPCAPDQSRQGFQPCAPAQALGKAKSAAEWAAADAAAKEAAHSAESDAKAEAKAGAADAAQVRDGADPTWPAVARSDGCEVLLPRQTRRDVLQLYDLLSRALDVQNLTF